MSKRMKRIILSIIAVGFAVAVQAGDCPHCQNKDQAACSAGKVKTSLDASASQVKDADTGGCCASKMKTSLEVNGTCPFAKAAAARQAKVKRTALLSPKAADLVW
jgi:hypothetical protein